jgi:hypothetical protein
MGADDLEQISAAMKPLMAAQGVAAVDKNSVYAFFVDRWEGGRNGVQGLSLVSELVKCQALQHPFLRTSVVIETFEGGLGIEVSGAALQAERSRAPSDYYLFRQGRTALSPRERRVLDFPATLLEQTQPYALSRDGRPIPISSPPQGSCLPAPGAVFLACGGLLPPAAPHVPVPRQLHHHRLVQVGLGIVTHALRSGTH